MQGSGGAFGRSNNPSRNVDLNYVNSIILSNSENIVESLLETVEARVVQTLQTSAGALGVDATQDSDATGLFLLVNSNTNALASNTNRIQTLEEEGGPTGADGALSDIALGLGLVGVTVETLENNTGDALSDLALGLGLVGLTVETHFNQDTESLGDLALGLGLVGVTVETLQTKTLPILQRTVETLEERVTSISPHPYARYVSLIGRPRDGFSAASVNIFMLNVAVFTPFNERGATILEFPDHNIALDKPVTTNVTSNSAFRITGMSPNGAHITGTDDVSDVRVLIDLGSEFLIEEIMITGILPDPEGGYPTGYNKILAVELLDTKLDVTWLSADYVNGTYGFIEDWSNAGTFAFSVRTPGVKT